MTCLQRLTLHSRGCSFRSAHLDSVFQRRPTWPAAGDPDPPAALGEPAYPPRVVALLEATLAQEIGTTTENGDVHHPPRGGRQPPE